MRSVRNQTAAPESDSAHGRYVVIRGSVFIRGCILSCTHSVSEYGMNTVYQEAPPLYSQPTYLSLPVPLRPPNLPTYLSLPALCISGLPLPAYLHTCTSVCRLIASQ